jgi:hypothetical protein
MFFENAKKRINYDVRRRGTPNGDAASNNKTTNQ